MKFLIAAVAFTCISMSALEKKVAPDRQIGRTEIRTLVQMFEYFHLRHDSVTNKDFARLIDVFLGELDPDHAYFLQADANQFTSKYGGSLVNSLRALGETGPADVVHDFYKGRVKERTAWIGRRMENWNLAPTEDVSAPPPSPTWVSEQKLLDQYWEHRLRNEWALDVVQGNDPRKAAERLRKHYEMLAAHIAARSADEVAVLLLNSFTALYDTRSIYYDAKTLANAAEAGTMKQMGIGATLKSIGDMCVFANVIPGGPSARCGKIQPGDRLVAVEASNQERIDVTGLELDEVVRLTQGPDGSEVTVVVEHPYSLGRETVRLTRGPVPSEHARAFLCREPSLSGRPGQLGVVVLPSLYGPAPDTSSADATEDVRVGLERLEGEGAEGLVLDLRGNGGGILLQATLVTGLFLGNEPIVRVKDHTGKVKVDQANPVEKVYRKPMVVLVDGVTGSGAEIIAGALQDYGRAVIVGNASTAGAGSIQVVLQMRNYMPRLASSAPLGAVKLTVQKFYLPNGASTEQKGIVSDIVLPGMPFKSAQASPDQAPQVPSDTLSAQVGPVDPGQSNRLAALKARSERRQAELPELLFLRKWSEEYARYAEKPTGNLEQLREEIRAREAAKVRFELEAGEVGKKAPGLQQIDPRDPALAKNYPAKTGLPDDSSGKQSFDPLLHEALRILADEIELVGVK